MWSVGGCRCVSTCTCSSVGTVGSSGEHVSRPVHAYLEFRFFGHASMRHAIGIVAGHSTATPHAAYVLVHALARMRVRF